MPLALALVASALIHAAAVLGSGWVLPGLNETDPPLPIEAVLVKPAPHAEPALVARSTSKAATDKPRSKPAAVSVPVAVAAEASPVAIETSPPVAAAPAPTIGPPTPPVEPTASPVPVKIELPRKGRVRYLITRGDANFVIGQSVHSWEHDGLTYQAQSVTETTGLAALFKPARIVQSSRGEVTAEGLRPLGFSNERIGGTDMASFDWTRNVVTYGGREDRVTAGAQDMLSMYYQLVLLAPTSGVLELLIATGRKLENYRFEILGEEALALPAGERRTVHLKTRSGNDTIELWLGIGQGAEMRGLPLKIRVTDRRGDIFDQLAEDIDLRETR